MAPFRWPETRHDISLAIEVSASNPVKAKDWDAIAERLSKAFSTDTNKVQLKGRGCRERMERLLDKYKDEDAKALKRLAVLVYILCTGQCKPLPPLLTGNMWGISHGLTALCPLFGELGH